MITLTQFPPRNPVILDGPYKRKVSRIELVSDALGIIAIGMILAVSFVGMTGALQ